MDVYAKVGLALDVCLKIGHLEVVVHPVDHEVREPRSLARGLEELVEELETLLAEMVAVYFEAHEGCVVEETLSEECETVVTDLIVC